MQSTLLFHKYYSYSDKNLLSWSIFLMLPARFFQRAQGGPTITKNALVGGGGTSVRVCLSYGGKKRIKKFYKKKLIKKVTFLLWTNTNTQTRGHAHQGHSLDFCPCRSCSRETL